MYLYLTTNGGFPVDDVGKSDEGACSAWRRRREALVPAACDAIGDVVVVGLGVVVVA